MAEQNRGERRRLEAEKRKFEAMMNQLATFAQQRAHGFGLELDVAFTQGDDIGVAVVLNFNRKDAEVCEAARIDLLVQRLETLIDAQPEIADEVEPTPD